ncbi:hypothetical protein [Fibrella forsythiae]|uniref:RDD family protein n=1 Tax=Fibrella forsythiae TaxID=2817061 RepID=A0ABS3JBX8_9BACT|nr:hypothetical protein [Fibrella forsythiae]MBO0947495.1 hypothetical protein [Fibrella forsythiae]
MNELLSSLSEKVKQFIEICVTLFLDFVLTIILWFIKSKTDSLLGFEKMQQKDQAFKWMMMFSTYGLYIVLSLFIIGDIARQALRIYIQIRQQLKEISESPSSINM